MLKTFTENIKTNKNFAFTKFGDSELFCMEGREGQNGDGHPYTPDLQERLVESFITLAHKKESYFAEWIGDGKVYMNSLMAVRNLTPTFIDYETFLMVKNHYSLDALSEFYKEVKQSERKKIYVCPPRSLPVTEFLGADDIMINQFNCWRDYDATLEVLRKAIEPNCVLMFSCTMLANVLIGDVYNEGITCLDLGSAFDPFIGLNNRDRQISPERAKELLK